MILRCLVHTAAALFLLLAIGLGIMWLRSGSHYDRYTKTFSDRLIAVGFAEGKFVFFDIGVGMSSTTTWEFSSSAANNSPFNDPFYIALAQREFSLAGIEYYVMPANDPAGQQFIFVHHVYLLGVPVWMMLVLSLLPPLLWCLWFRRHFRRQARIKGGLCLKCGYDLRGAESKACPECGAATATVA